MRSPRLSTLVVLTGLISYLAIPSTYAVYAQTSTATPGDSTPPASPPPADARKYGYKPAPNARPNGQPGTSVTTLPDATQAQLKQDAAADKSREPSRESMAAYARGLAARAKQIHAIRIAGTEVQP